MRLRRATKSAVKNIRRIFGCGLSRRGLILIRIVHARDEFSRRKIQSSVILSASEDTERSDSLSIQVIGAGFFASLRMTNWGKFVFVLFVCFVGDTSPLLLRHEPR